MAPAAQPSPPPVTATITVAELLTEHPGAARVFLRHQMACVGCSVSRFDTLADAAREYHLPLAHFLSELAAAASQAHAPRDPPTLARRRVQRTTQPNPHLHSPQLRARAQLPTGDPAMTHANVHVHHHSHASDHEPPPEALPQDLAQARVADVARLHPATIRVLQRHAVDFCCGGKRPIAEAAQRAKVDLDTLLGDLRQAIDAPEHSTAWLDALPSSSADLGKLIVGRYHVALRSELPRLVAMANRVETVHGDGMPEVLPPLAATVRELAAELEAHMREEEDVVFPAIERLERAAVRGEQPAVADLESLVAAREEEHTEAGAKLRTLRELTSDFVPPEWACNTFRGLYHGLAELERDLHEHIHLENNVLFPRALALAARNQTVC